MWLNASPHWHPLNLTSMPSWFSLHLVVMEGAIILEVVVMSLSSLSSQWWLCGGCCHHHHYYWGSGRIAVAIILVISILSIAILITRHLRGFSGGLMKDRRAKTGHNRLWLDFVVHLLTFHSLSGPSSFPILHPSSCENPSCGQCYSPSWCCSPSWYWCHLCWCWCWCVVIVVAVWWVSSGVILSWQQGSRCQWGGIGGCWMAKMSHNKHCGSCFMMHCISLPLYGLPLVFIHPQFLHWVSMNWPTSLWKGRGRSEWVLLNELEALATWLTSLKKREGILVRWMHMFGKGWGSKGEGGSHGTRENGHNHWYPLLSSVSVVIRWF